MMIDRVLRPGARTLAALLAVCACAAGAAEQAPAPTPAKAAKPKAAASAASATAEARMLARLKELYPGTTFTSVDKTPIAGVFEVVMGPNIAYVGTDARHFLFGHLFDLRDQVDLTAQRLQQGTASAAPGGDPAAPSQPVDFAKLPLQDAIVQVNGSGARKVVVFTDPRCPYCRQLEADLPQLADATIYFFLIPILGPDSREAAQKRWALAMPDRALDTAVLDRNLQLAQRLGVQATPTLVRADGQVNAGAMTLPELTAWLEAADKVAQAPAPTPSAVP